MRLNTHANKPIPMALSMIAAGPAAEIVEDYDLLDVNALVTRGREGFSAFEITGHSDAPHMLPGYIVFVDTWAEPRNGQMIAAVVNGLVCIKKFQHSHNGLRLVSRNPQYAPVEITPRDNFHVLGVVRGHLALDS